MKQSVVKTTFLLSDSRRARLKALAAERNTTVTELLAEGADLVLEKYERRADREVLAARAREATARLRAGLYDGPGLSDAVDQVVYPVRKKSRGRRK